jgi:hypothetical protein
MGVTEAAGTWRLGPKIYEVKSFRRKDFSVTSVTVQCAFIVGGGIPPRRLGDGVSRHLSRPRERNGVPRLYEPSRTDWWALPPSYTANHRAGSTTTHRPKKLTRTATVQRALVGSVVFRPRRLGEDGARHRSRPRGGTGYRGATNQVGLTAGLCGLPRRQGIGPDQLKRTDRKKYHDRRGKRPNTTYRRK